MRKKILSIIFTMALFLGLISSSVIKAEAVEPPLVTPPGFTHDGPTRGEMIKLTRGTFLQRGYSDLSKTGVGQIFIEGETIATQPVSEVGIHCAIQQWNESTQGWSQYDYIFASNYNASYVNVRKTLTVKRGYYYRVASTHFAGNDEGYSYSSGAWIG